MQTDKASKIRMAVLAGMVLLFLGGTMIAGLVERFWPAQTSNAETGPSREEMAALRAEMQEMLTLRKQFVAQSKKEQWRQSAALAEKYLAHKESAFVRRVRAEAWFREGKIAEGGWEFAQLLPGDEPVSVGAHMILRGDLAAYREHCTNTLNALNPSSAAASEANNTAWLCVLAPDAQSDYSTILRLAESGAAGAQAEDKANFLNTLGVALYRAGRDAEAIETLRECERLRSSPFNWPFLALAHHRLGREFEARQWQEKLRQRLNTTFGTMKDQEARHELLLFWHETEQAMPLSAAAAPTS